MRATYFAVLMILYAAANILAVMQGVEEMKQLTKLTSGISFVVLTVYYISIGLFYMAKRSKRVDTR